jgi:RNA polymerase sigma-70 factor (ECF subfamily)
MVHDTELASDLIQDTFHAAWSAALLQIAPFAGEVVESDVRRWLYRVAYRRAIDLLRHRHAIRWEPLDMYSDLLPEQHDGFEDRIAESDAMTQAMATLLPEDIACLMLIVVHRFAAHEAAQIMGSSHQAIRKRVARAKQRLARAYLSKNAQ